MLEHALLRPRRRNLRMQRGCILDSGRAVSGDLPAGIEGSRF